MYCAQCGVTMSPQDWFCRQCGFAASVDTPGPAFEPQVQLSQLSVPVQGESPGRPLGLILLTLYLGPFNALRYLLNMSVSYSTYFVLSRTPGATPKLISAVWRFLSSNSRCLSAC